MSDKPPLLGAVARGALTAANGAASEALKACEGMGVVFKIQKAGANQRRRAFYWVMLDVAAEALSARLDDPLDAELLHDVLKRKLKLGREIKLPGGEIIFKPQSTSNRAMAEPERARWTNRCAITLSHWLGCEVKQLMDEARAKNGGRGPEKT